MPKMKTHKGAAKRIKKSGTGKLIRRQRMRAHMLEKKSSRRKRALAHEAEVSAADSPRIKRLLGEH